jgi:hypothetical protein
LLFTLTSNKNVVYDTTKICSYVGLIQVIMSDIPVS